MEATIFYKANATLGEGPLWDYKRGVLFFVDVEGKKLHMMTMQGEDTVYEMPSRIGTVGLTLGITPGLSEESLLILILLMFVGRVGGLTLVFTALSKRSVAVSKLPRERITVG